MNKTELNQKDTIPVSNEESNTNPAPPSEETLKKAREDHALPNSFPGRGTDTFPTKPEESNE